MRRAPALDYQQYVGLARSDDWSVRAMRVRCATLRSHLVARAGMDDAALAAWWPGGAENKKRKAYAWNICHARYSHLAGKADALRDPSDGAADRRLQRAVTDALADTAVAVPLADGTTQHVFPKAYRVHEILSDLDADLAALSVAEMAVSDAAATLGIPVTPYGLRADVTAVWLWIVTTPGPGLPYDETQPAPQPPAWTRTVTPEDVLALTAAFHQLDRGSIAIMSAAFPKTNDGPSRLSFAGFLGTFAASKHLDPLDVMRRWAVRRVIAAAVSESVTHEDAKRAADAERVRGAMAPRVPVTHA